MNYVEFGNTGFMASRYGLGCGWLGRNNGFNDSQSIELVHTALDLGINFFDTSEMYGTEEVLGRALKKVPRDSIYICSKKPKFEWEETGEPLTPTQLRDGLEASLKRLDTDYLDVYLLHGLWKTQYDYARNELLPVFHKMKAQGKIRSCGFSEDSGGDPGHTMAIKAATEGGWDVMLIAFNILFQQAREKLLPLCIEKNIAVMTMYSIRKKFDRMEYLRDELKRCIRLGYIDPNILYANKEPLSKFVHEGGAQNITDLGLRFCTTTEGIHVVLNDSSNVEHMKQNAEYLSHPPLPEKDYYKLVELFHRCI